MKGFEDHQVHITMHLEHRQHGSPLLCSFAVRYGMPSDLQQNRLARAASSDRTEQHQKLAVPEYRGQARSTSSGWQLEP